jgi:hypothetical protein
VRSRAGAAARSRSATSARVGKPSSTVAGRHDERLGAGAGVVGLRPVAEQDADVGERVAQRRHLPVEDGRDRPGVVGSRIVLSRR